MVNKKRECCDFNAVCDIGITLACICSSCRLCLMGNPMRKGGVADPLVEIETCCPGYCNHRVYYCPPCYSFLLSRMEDSNRLPSLDDVLDSKRHIERPWYELKKDDPLLLYYPDEIDLGAWRQKRQQEVR